MLAAVRKALTGSPISRSGSPDLDALPPLGRILPPIDPASLVSHFEQELEKVAASAHRAGSRQQIADLLGRILGQEQGNGVVLSRNPLLVDLDVESMLRGLGIRFQAWPSDSEVEGRSDTSAASPPGPPGYRDFCFSAAAGITGVDFALAESGSLVLTSETEGAQLSSLAPPIHIALYSPAQVVESLEEVLRGLHPSGGGTPAGRDGRSIVFVTGTSRTADIEQILIRGVHGPREVHAILVEDGCLTSPA